MNKYIICAAATVLALGWSTADISWGRGFGGFHGGGRIPGGLGGQLHSLASTGQLNQNPGGYDAMDTLGTAAAMGVYGQPAGNPFVPGGGFAPGGGYRPTGVGIGTGGFGGAPSVPAPVVGPTAAQRQRRVASQLVNPNVGGLAHLGAVMSSGGRATVALPSDAGLHAVATRTPLGGTGQPGPSARAAAGAGGVAPPRGLRTVSIAQLHQTGAAVRRNFSDSLIYSQSWYAAHPGAWAPASWRTGSAWRAATWAQLNSWFGSNKTQPLSYNYGTDIVYRGDEVSVRGGKAISSTAYYQQAQSLAAAGAAAQVSDDGQWLPLGVFGMTHIDHAQANLVFQLAVNKAGIIRGNYSDTISGSTALVAGAIDKNSQRAAWTVGNNKSTVVETGLYSFTKDEAPALIHVGKDNVQQWTLVRLTQNNSSGVAK